MSIKTFWNIVLKVLGIWLLFESFYIFPQFLVTTAFIDLNESDVIKPILILTFCTLFYLFLVWIFIFKTNWLITKLRLEKSFDEKQLNLTVESPVILSIAILILGGVIFISSVPQLCRELITFFQQEIVLRKYPSTGWICFYIIKSVAGYLLMTNSKTVARFIIKKGGESIS